MERELILGYEISFRNLSSPLGLDWKAHMEKYNWKRRKTFTHSSSSTREGLEIADAYKVLYKSPPPLTASISNQPAGARPSVILYIHVARLSWQRAVFILIGWVVG